MKKLHISPWFLLPLVAIIWRLIYAYYPVIHFHYVTPPGDDGAVHMQYITNLISNGLKIDINGYPTGFHIIVVYFSKIFHQTPLNVLVWFTPILMVIPIIAIYYAGKKLFDHPAVGAFAALFWGFIALGPVRAYGDGNYPNLIASGFYLPLAITFYYLLINKPKWKYLILAIIFSVLIIITHHLTVVYLVIAIIPWLISVFIGYVTKAKLRRKMLLIISVFVALIALTALSWIVIGPLAKPFVDVLLSGGSLASVFGAISKPVTLWQIEELNNPLLIIAGLIGLLILMVSNANRPIKYLFAFWILILFGFSITSYFGLPGRFVRELALPLSLTFGYGAFAVYNWADKYNRGWMARIIIILVISIDFVLSFSRPFALPQPFEFIQRVQEEQADAYKWVNDHNIDNKIVISNNANLYVPYLINSPVVTVLSPSNIPASAIVSSARYIIIGARPSQSGEDLYPYFAGFDQISAALKAIPNVKLVKEYKLGTLIYEYVGK